MRLRTLIVDDEPLSREKVRSFLEHYSDFEIIGEYQDGERTAIAILEQQPDVVFLDVEIPGWNGLELLNSLPRCGQPSIVVVTAFDRYAVRAFEVEALDYLLKPFTKARFAQAINRLRQNAACLKSGRQDGLNIAVQRSPDYKRVVVKCGSKILVLHSTSIAWIEAQGDYVMVHVQKSGHLVRETMNSIEKRLDPSRFVRIHRSAIVNLDFIRELRPLWGGDYCVLLHDGAQLTLSRSYRSRVQTKLLLLTT